MADGRPFQAAGPGVPALIEELVARQPLFTWAAIVLTGLTLVTLAALLLDPRMLDGQNVWLKPLKFEISLTVFLLTLAWCAGWLPRGVAERDWFRLFTAVVVGCVALEMLWIAGAAAFGLRSHFNTDVAFLRAVYPFMGAVAAVLTSAALVFGSLILGYGDSELAPPLRHAVGLGLILTFVLTVLVAGTMAGWPGATGAPVPTVDAGSSWLGGLLGWRSGAGDLRPAHFYATHAMQAVPLLGWLLCRLFPASSQTGAGWTLLLVWLAGLAYTAFVGYLFLQALRERAAVAST